MNDCDLLPECFEKAPSVLCELVMNSLSAFGFSSSDFDHPFAY